MDSSDKTDPSPPRPPAGTAQQGTLIAGRFTLEHLAGRGGMGSVYRASDSTTGRPVALKLLHAATSPETTHRFHREAVLLAGLSHPGIVSYVAHGSLESGQHYLAMEWLEGEDLAQRLLREPLRLPEVVSLLRCAAEALSVAHQHGIVHRDLKPSNLFLRGGKPEDVVVLDFGLARQAEPSLMGVTGTGAVVGTPGYMAPEQASSELEIPPASDIFSLGCVLYECLTGRPPFAAPHFAAVLAKILFAEPARLYALRPGLPSALQVLVDRMLVKDPKRRLSDADSLLKALAELEPVPEVLLPHAETDQRPVSLEGAEQQLASVLMVSHHPVAREAETVDLHWGGEQRDTLRAELSAYGARVELLAGGSLVATLVPERGSATDQAALAARCALTFKERWPEAAVVLTTGLGVFNERLPVGEAMDRAGRLLRQLEQMPSSSSVVMDDVTAGLLGPGFQLSRLDSGAFLLQGEHLGADASRPLLGKPTPCVGREQELALLEFSLNACIEEPAARAMLVTAPAGVGKSRLRHEFLRRLERREQQPLVLLGRGDPMSAGASYGLLGQALRQLCGIVEGESLETRRMRLRQRVALHLPSEESREVVEFLGELCAVPFPEGDSPRLQAARSDPFLMSTQVGRALVAFLTAECAHQPVLLMLEDLHWSDALTVMLVDEALRALVEQPFMVLALARPEVKELFPGLWSRRLQEVPLNGLSRKAGAKLVREVLGSEVPEDVVRRVVEQSDGNALFLEELIRMESEGRGEGAPETVLAVLQARLTRMEPGLRQVLLAGSVFGRNFWPGGVAALVGQSVGETLERYLQLLVEQELIEPLSDGRFRGVPEYRFHHALLGDAAYGLVPDSHRPVCHRLAGEWLEHVGEPDPLELATHYQLGQQPQRAVHFYTRAAERLLERYDLQGMGRCVESALACGGDGKALIPLRALQATVAFWEEDFTGCYELGRAVLPEMRAGSASWCKLMCGLIGGGAQSGRQEYVAELALLLMRTTPDAEAMAAYTEALSFLSNITIWCGARELASNFRARMVDVGDGTRDGLALGWMCCTHGFFEYFFEPMPWQAFDRAERGTHAFREVGAEFSSVATHGVGGLALVALGETARGVTLLREGLSIARRQDRQKYPIGYARLHLALVLADGAEAAWRDEAEALALEGRKEATPNYLHQGQTLLVLAKVAAGRGQQREAETLVLEACELLVPFPTYLLFARRFLGSLLLAQGRAGEARQVAERGLEELARMGGAGVHAVGMHLALAEACFLMGDDSVGEAALREASRCVRIRAQDIPHPAARERFLSQVPENARALELARRRWGEAAA
ncbi:serine/threonine-protein kinase [Archangium lansingense]|uniref:Protein kinase n=1 Tax=Archangium lansingense TaxID=2995310 RepID=A0ABT4A3T8_9BACT|nr:serine/threonine-protein kinase [Archangium lansinium]MCY1076268.1 protein kinase [Archangium lansinium]